MKSDEKKEGPAEKEMGRRYEGQIKKEIREKKGKEVRKGK